MMIVLFVVALSKASRERINHLEFFREDAQIRKKATLICQFISCLGRKKKCRIFLKTFCEQK